MIFWNAVINAHMVGAMCSANECRRRKTKKSFPSASFLIRSNPWAAVPPRPSVPWAATPMHQSVAYPLLSHRDTGRRPPSRQVMGHHHVWARRYPTSHGSRCNELCLGGRCYCSRLDRNSVAYACATATSIRVAIFLARRIVNLICEVCCVYFRKRRSNVIVQFESKT